jgi:hypothetical protein
MRADHAIPGLYRCLNGNNIPIMYPSLTTRRGPHYHLAKGAPLNAAVMFHANVVSFAAAASVIAGVIGASQYGIVNSSA